MYQYQSLYYPYHDPWCYRRSYYRGWYYDHRPWYRDYRYYRDWDYYRY